MNDSAQTGTAAIRRALALLRAIAADCSVPLSHHARRLGIPSSSAYRIAAELREQGLIMPAGRGCYAPAPGLLALATETDPQEAMVAVARPLLRRLARRMKATVHLGVFEDDMITYLVKEHGGGNDLFTREGSQLEAYCSAIGKVLLASLEEAQREAYLAGGPFPKMTARTYSEADEIRVMLNEVEEAGFAVDDREAADDLFCIAVPIIPRDGAVSAAISLSRTYRDGLKAEPPVALLDCAEAIAERLSGSG